MGAENPWGCARGREEVARLRQLRLHRQEIARTARSDAAERDSLRGQPLVRVIGSQRKPVFGAGSEHPVRLAHALGGQIVDHDPDIRLSPVQHRQRLPACLSCGVDARESALPGSLFVSRRSVDLAGQKDPVMSPGLQSRIERPRINIVVFDRVAGAQDFEPAPARGSFESSPAERLPEERLKFHWDRRSGCRSPQARGRVDGSPGRRNAQPCPRLRGSTSGRGRRSRRSEERTETGSRERPGGFPGSSG